MTAGKRRVVWFLPLLILIVGISFHPVWLSASGRFLESAGEPRRSDAIVVLAGDGFGQRILKGCDLVRQGYAPVALVSGPAGNYGYYESDLAIPFAVKHGCAREWFAGVPNECRSTREEAALFARELHRRGIKSYLLVTSNYHTRRAGRLFRAAAPDLSVQVISTPDFDFDPDAWWHSRQGMKIFVYEWLKTVSGWFGV